MRNRHAGQPFTTPDERIAEALLGVSIPTLMLSLVHMSGDAGLIRGDLKAAGLFLNEVRGYMSEEDKAAVRKIALEVIADYRDRGCPEPEPIGAELLREMMQWLVCEPVPDVGNHDSRLPELLLHERPRHVAGQRRQPDLPVRMPDALHHTMSGTVDHRRSHDDGTDCRKTTDSNGARPAGEMPGSAALYLHGGGMIFGLDHIGPMYELAVRRYVAESGVPMLVVDYRVAPEHPHPTPVEDCYAALEWLAGKATTLGFDPGRLAVMGDSAGGGLAAGVCLMARDRGGPAVAQQILIYPMLDDRPDTAAVPDMEL